MSAVCSDAKKDACTDFSSPCCSRSPPAVGQSGMTRARASICLVTAMATPVMATVTLVTAMGTEIRVLPSTTSVRRTATAVVRHFV
jgi:hypothetical protein